MNQSKRCLAGVLLSLVLLVPAAAPAGAEPAAGAPEGWAVTLLDLFDDLLDRLWTVRAASSDDSDSDKLLIDDTGNEVTPTWDPLGSRNQLQTSPSVTPTWDPLGAL